MKKADSIARYRADADTRTGPGFLPAYPANGISVEWYSNEVPPFAEVELDRLYGSMYASMGHFRIYGGKAPTNTYVVRKDGRALVILLFRLHGACLQVINEVIALEMVEINRFARFVFATFPDAGVVLFKALRTGEARPDYFFQRYNHLEDIVLPLPDTVEAYFAGLGKNTRRNIKRYQRKLLAAHPTFAFKVLHTDQVDGQTAREIIHLNAIRMAEKSKLSNIGERRTEEIIRQARHCGLIGVATVEGRICGGGISFRAGANYFLSVIAHDPFFDDYWLGTLCSYLMVCECIARGGREFHFLWGEYDYKYTLQGVKRDLDNLALYRSPLHMALHPVLALKLARLGLARRVHQWLHAQVRKDQLAIRMARKMVKQWRSLRNCSRTYPTAPR